MIEIIFYIIGCVAAYGRINASKECPHYIILCFVCLGSWITYSMSSIFWILDGRIEDFFDFKDR